MNITTIYYPGIQDRIDIISIPRDPEIYGPESYDIKYIIPKSADISYLEPSSIIDDFIDWIRS